MNKLIYPLAAASLIALTAAFIKGPSIPRDNLPYGFVAIEANNNGPKGEETVINTQQLSLAVSTWDPKMDPKKRTAKNAHWTIVKMSNNEVFYLDIKLNKFLNDVRNSQRN